MAFTFLSLVSFHGERRGSTGVITSTHPKEEAIPGEGWGARGWRQTARHRDGLVSDQDVGPLICAAWFATHLWALWSVIHVV